MNGWFIFCSYFKFLDWFGVSCYQKLAVANLAERGARMKCVGVLAEDHGLLHHHMPYLRHHVRYVCSPTNSINAWLLNACTSPVHALPVAVGTSLSPQVTTVPWRSTTDTATYPPVLPPQRYPCPSAAQSCVSHRR